MHVAIANLTNGGLSGGSWKYLQRMVPLLQGHHRVSRLTVIVPRDFMLPLRELTNAHVSTWPDLDERRQFRGLRAQLEAVGPSVVLVPSTRPLQLSNAPTVVMMRNMEPPLLPLLANPWHESLKNIVRNWQSRLACGRALHVIAVSQFVERFLKQRWRVPAEKITRIYHGIEAAPPRTSAVCPPSVSPISERSFVFTAGSIRPARGLEDLLRALADLQTNYGISLPAVIAGKPDHGMDRYAARLKRLAAALRVADHVHWAGALTASEMSWCYYHCAAFVMTSRAEACPNVALEAMVHGCPVVSVESPPMPEFFPATALYYQAGNTRLLAAQLQHCLAASSSERARWQAASLVRAADFSWHRTARETVDLLYSLKRAPAKRRAAA